MAIHTPPYKFWQLQKCCELGLFHGIDTVSYFFGDTLDWDANILVFKHEGFKVKVIDVNFYPACIGHGYGAVSKIFYCENFCCWRVYLSAVIDPIATYSPYDSS